MKSKSGLQSQSESRFLAWRILTDLATWLMRFAECQHDLNPSVLIGVGCQLTWTLNRRWSVEICSRAGTWEPAEIPTKKRRITRIRADRFAPIRAIRSFPYHP